MTKLYQMLNSIGFKEISMGGSGKACEYDFPGNHTKNHYAILVHDGMRGLSDSINTNPTIVIEDIDTGETITIQGRVVEHPEADDWALD